MKNKEILKNRFYEVQVSRANKEVHNFGQGVNKLSTLFKKESLLS